jgi:hypothetical protein
MTNEFHRKFGEVDKRGEAEALDKREHNPFEETDHDNRTCDHVKSVRQNETHTCDLPAKHEGPDGLFYCHRHFLIHEQGTFSEYDSEGDYEQGNFEEDITVTELDDEIEMVDGEDDSE